MPTDEQIKEAYAYALAFAAQQAPGQNEMADAAINAATDAVMRAVEKYQPERGEFVRFAKGAVRTFVRRGLAKHRLKLARRPQTLTIDAENDEGEKRHPEWLATTKEHGPGELGLPLSVRELPRELQDTVRLYYLDGLKLREVALLTGVPYKTAWDRLREAARRLGGGMRPRRRKTGARRVGH